jgi:hypothetical protein
MAYPDTPLFCITVVANPTNVNALKSLSRIKLKQKGEQTECSRLTSIVLIA